jgi:SpoIID/LytB domain protein
MPLPPGLQDEAVNRWWIAALVACSVGLHGATDDVTLRVSIDGRVTRLALEDYIARVVAGEGQPQAAAGAQQALAITARTYALANRNRHRREGFDLCDTTHCQVVRPATAVTRRAAQATAGMVLTHQGQPASVFYSALCGGHSELASEVWPGADNSSSHLHEDDACRDEPGWSSTFRAADIERALREAGYRGRLRELRIVQRNDSGRVARVRAEGFMPNELSGHDFRMAMARELGIRNFKSTAFEVRRSGSTYTFTGSGFGHGVGLCVIGAGRRASRGDTADAILKFYFPNLRTATLSGLSTSARTAVAKPVPPPVPKRETPPAPKTTSRAPVAADVTVTVDDAASPDRVEIVRQIRQARDQIAKRAGIGPLAAIRVTVHPSVDAFVRATGQPWWVSGASDGSQIDLVPMALLRQRGQVERTIRREVARVLTDPTLKGKSMWVREGAAAYFADPDVKGDTHVSGGCPKDEELLQPSSAGAHRNALARAEACFRRDIARGRAWTQIR